MAETALNLKEIGDKISVLKEQLQGMKSAGKAEDSFEAIASYVYNNTSNDHFVVQKTGEKTVSRFHASSKLSTGGSSGDGGCCTVV